MSKINIKPIYTEYACGRVIAALMYQPCPCDVDSTSRSRMASEMSLAQYKQHVTWNTGDGPWDINPIMDPPVIATHLTWFWH